MTDEKIKKAAQSMLDDAWNAATVALEPQNADWRGADGTVYHCRVNFNASQAYRIRKPGGKKGE